MIRIAITPVADRRKTRNGFVKQRTAAGGQTQRSPVVKIIRLAPDWNDSSAQIAGAAGRFGERDK